ncbi:hypothetical protein ACIQ2D_08700 [Lysinibacillus sp. NPDC097287]|uniref:hypothetical protein n=1 Tax=Lysinibacillus sp. NPDC097287 TaxID=3364144 RepID=UPI00380F0766
MDGISNRGLELEIIYEIISENEKHIKKFEEQLEQRKANKEPEEGNHFLEGIICGIQGVNTILKNSIVKY